MRLIGASLLEMRCSMVFQGDIIQVSLDPTLGHEPNKTRPVLVVSADSFNLRSSLTYIAPITSVNNGYPLHVPIDKNDAGVEGYACLEQMRSIDLNARPHKKLGVLEQSALDSILDFFPAIFDL